MNLTDREEIRMEDDKLRFTDVAVSFNNNGEKHTCVVGCGETEIRMETEMTYTKKPEHETELDRVYGKGIDVEALKEGIIRYNDSTGGIKKIKGPIVEALFKTTEEEDAKARDFFNDDGENNE